MSDYKPTVNNNTKYMFRYLFLVNHINIQYINVGRKWPQILQESRETTKIHVQ